MGRGGRRCGLGGLCTCVGARRGGSFSASVQARGAAPARFEICVRESCCERSVWSAEGGGRSETSNTVQLKRHVCPPWPGHPRRPAPAPAGRARPPGPPPQAASSWPRRAPARTGRSRPRPRRLLRPRRRCTQPLPRGAPPRKHGESVKASAWGRRRRPYARSRAWFWRAAAAPSARAAPEAKKVGSGKHPASQGAMAPPPPIPPRPAPPFRPRFPIRDGQAPARSHGAGDVAVERLLALAEPAPQDFVGPRTHSAHFCSFSRLPRPAPPPITADPPTRPKCGWPWMTNGEWCGGGDEGMGRP